MVRCYRTHKRGEFDSDIQDSIGVDEQTNRFSISDGVTSSFIPQILSKILTDAFVSTGMAGFPPSNLKDVFAVEREAYLNSLDDDQLFLQEMVEEEFKDSAATFVGVELTEDAIRWMVIGDSCLFILPDEGGMSCYCSNDSHWDSDNKFHVAFDNHPAKVLSSGQIQGEIIQGESKISSCWLLLASDAMSAWFINAYNNLRNPLSILSQISDNEEFEKFVDKECGEGNLTSDDESVVLIRLEGAQEIGRVSELLSSNSPDEGIR